MTTTNLDAMVARYTNKADAAIRVQLTAQRAPSHCINIQLFIIRLMLQSHLQLRYFHWFNALPYVTRATVPLQLTY